eukprot:jgi/Botrbrau1/11590/Bobra.247_1s0011.1
MEEPQDTNKASKDRELGYMWMDFYSILYRMGDDVGACPNGYFFEPGVFFSIRQRPELITFRTTLVWPTKLGPLWHLAPQCNSVTRKSFPNLLQTLCWAKNLPKYCKSTQNNFQLVCEQGVL